MGKNGQKVFFPITSQDNEESEESNVGRYVKNIVRNNQKILLCVSQKEEEPKVLSQVFANLLNFCLSL